MIKQCFMKRNIKSIRRYRLIDGTQAKAGSRRERGMSELFTRAKILFVQLAVAACLLAVPAAGCAAMGVMSDSELDAISAKGFSSFSMVDGVALADFTGLAVSTYTEIDSLKMGYWDRNDGNGTGWDQNWTGVKLGASLADPTGDLTLNGFYVKAVFDPTTIDDPANRRLTRVSMGSSDVSGDLSANFASLSRELTEGGLPVIVNNRANVGEATYHFDHTELSLNVVLEGQDKGIWVNFGDAN